VSPATAPVLRQYSTGRVRGNIQAALEQTGWDGGPLAPHTLESLEDFHTLGRIATQQLIGLADVDSSSRVLDSGCGIGGTARYLASEIGCHVRALDISPEYCEVARWLNEVTRLDSFIDVVQGDAQALPFDDESFDIVISQHVLMNVADTARVFREVRRVLRPGGRFVFWEIARGEREPIITPVPWADQPESSHLDTPRDLRAMLLDAALQIAAWSDLSEPSALLLEGFLAGPVMPLGLHTYVPEFALKASNLLENLRLDRVRAIQAVMTAA
jgi:sarcosine/dimethylglycine N-methyltransferase